MSIDNSLTVSLEEFGLSQYEARAYFAMISKGPVSATELAYYSKIPRTKVYSTLQKLRKKKLATISDTKPLMCAAVAPEEAFDSTIQEQINKVNAMNSLISGLKTVNDESRKSRGIEERRYHRLAAGNMIAEMQGLIEGARRTIDVAASQRGHITETRKGIVAAGRRGVAVRIILPPSETSSEKSGVLPGGARIRVLPHMHNYMVVDGSSVLVLDGSGGGETLSMADGITHNLHVLFESLWEGSVPAESLLDMTRAESEDVYAASSILGRFALASSLKAAMSGKMPRIADLLEECGVPVYERTLSDLVDLASAALKTSSGGACRLDAAKGAISLYSDEGNGQELAWAAILNEYLKRHGYGARMMPQDESEKIYIRLEKAGSLNGHAA